MKGAKLNPTSDLSDAQDNRGRDSEIDYVNDIEWASLKKFMEFYYAKYGENGRDDDAGTNGESTRPAIVRRLSAQ